MENAIWAIFYDVPDDIRSAYLDWFHNVHLPQTLSRPGYLWAAHYEVIPRVERSRLNYSDAPPLPMDSGYALMLGGESTRTFFDPSPSQLEAGYDPETREMLGRRTGSVSYIYTVEWRINGPDSEKGDPSGMPAPFMQTGCFDASGQDEDLGAWYTQERMDLWSRTPGSVSGRKLLAAAGPQRHAVLYDFVSRELHATNFPPLNQTEWTARVHGYLIHPRGSAMVGRRIWPAP